MKGIRYHPAAEIELNEAAEFYEGKVKELGRDFLKEIQRAL